MPLMPGLAIEGPQLILRGFKSGAIGPGERLTGAVDVEGQHGHSRAEWIGLAAPALLGGTTEGARDRPRIAQSEDAGL